MIYRQDIKLMAFIMSAMFWGSGYAADNSIYIDQTGDYSNIAITQDGSSNKVYGIRNNTAGQTTDAAYINGLGVALSIEQVGAGNTLALGIDTGKATTGTTINYSVSGGSNVGFINLSGGSNVNKDNVVGVTQTNGSNYTTLNLQGSNNTVSATQSGGNATFTSTITGDSNTQTVNTSGGTNNSVTITQDAQQQASVTLVGGYNTVGITQSDGQHQASISATGSNNSYTVYQQGSSANNVLGITTSGAHNSYTINQNKTP